MKRSGMSKVFHSDEKEANLFEGFNEAKSVAMLHRLLCSQLQLRAPVEGGKKRLRIGVIVK